MVDPIILYALLAGLAVILALGALEKWRRFASFESAVAGYQLLPAVLVKPFALAFALAESLAALGLLLPASRSHGAALALVVLGAATLGIAVNLARGRRDVDCGCGGLGHASAGLSGWLVLRNLALLAAAGLIWLDGHGNARELGWLDGITFFGATLAMLGLYCAANLLIDFQTRLNKTKGA